MLFPSHMKDIFDQWIAGELESKPCYTKGGNLKNPDQGLICDWVVQSFNSLSESLIKKSFLVVGQSIQATPSDVTCLKVGNYAHSCLETVQEIWDQSKEDLMSVEDPIPIADEDQDVINEQVDEEDEEDEVDEEEIQ